MNNLKEEGVLSAIAVVENEMVRKGKHLGTEDMLDHSRGNVGELCSMEMNTFVDEYVKLGYPGMRTNDANFNVTIHTEYDSAVGALDVIPQDLSRGGFGPRCLILHSVVERASIGCGVWFVLRKTVGGR